MTTDAAPLPPKVENVFHEDIWATANKSLRIERAVSEARDAMYLLLTRNVRGATKLDEAAEYTLNAWLDTFGRDSFREQMLAGERERAEVK